MTDKVVDLSARRNAAEKPDPEYVRRDDFGREMQLYLLAYEYNGGSWSADVWAYSMEDAQARVAAMRDSLELRGQIFTTRPA